MAKSLILAGSRGSSDCGISPWTITKSATETTKDANTTTVMVEPAFQASSDELHLYVNLNMVLNTDASMLGFGLWRTL